MRNPERVEISAARRATAYWFTDGLADIVAGATLVIVGCMWLIIWDRTLPPTARLLIVAISWLLMLAVIVCDRELIDFIKSRVTYPRTGYVRAPGINTRLKSVLVLLFGRIVAQPINSGWAVPAVLLGCGVTLFMLNRNNEGSYPLWSVLLLPVVGLASLLLEVPIDRQEWLIFVIGGLWLLAQGASHLLTYLRENPRRVASVRTQS